MITPEVEQIANTVFAQITNCSQTMAGPAGLFDVFYQATDIWGLFANLIIMGGNIGLEEQLPSWFQALYGSGPGSQYYACVNTAALYWKTAMALALLGLLKFNPETSKLEWTGSIDLKQPLLNKCER